MGADFVAANGQRSHYLISIARCACIPFSWIGAIICYLWGKDLYGRPAGLLACLLWCFDPSILGHGALITPDAHCAALGVAANYTFWRWLINPTWSGTLLAGAVLGVAELSKTTLLLLYPIWPLVWVVYRWNSRNQMNARRWAREASMLLLRMVLGVAVLNSAYGFSGSFQRLGTLTFVSALLSRQTHDVPIQIPQSSLVDVPEPGNRFRNTWLGALPLPLPRDYALGIDLQQRDFEHYGRPFYLAGTWSKTGWFYYYGYALLVKEPASTILLIMLCIADSLGCLIRRSAFGFPKNRELILLLPAIVIFFTASLKTGINEHTRYVLPALPFLFIWTGRLTSFIDVSQSGTTSHLSFRSTASSTRVVPAFTLMVLAAWLVTSSCWIFPHSLSFFNEFAGGPLNGANHLLGSNLDWGQDLTYLAAELEAEREHANALCVSSFNPALVYGPALTVNADVLDSFGRPQWPLLPKSPLYISRNYERGANGFVYDSRGAKHPIYDGALSFLTTQSADKCVTYAISRYNAVIPRNVETSTQQFSR
ncbi:ArnT family glycosyltransferase [Botrimarina colliarenosi]|nr:glycosyltransferase family 39 protein [Botrimarina colliarenosi]